MKGGYKMPQQVASLIMPIAFIAIFYFLLIRPQQKRDKQLKEMRSNLKIGQEIVTIGGMIGKIMKVEEDHVVVEIGPDKTKMPVEKWAIGKIKNK